MNLLARLLPQPKPIIVYSRSAKAASSYLARKAETTAKLRREITEAKLRSAVAAALEVRE